jgi:acyl carrier protein
VNDLQIRVIQCIADSVGIPHIDDIDMETSLDTDLGMDSLDKAECLLEIESEFECSLDNDNFLDCKTVGDVVAKVEKVLGASA